MENRLGWQLRSWPLWRGPAASVFVVFLAIGGPFDAISDAGHGELALGPRARLPTPGRSAATTWPGTPIELGPGGADSFREDVESIVDLHLDEVADHADRSTGHGLHVQYRRVRISDSISASRV